MATIKTQNNRRNAANTGWDVIHQETSADIVLMDDGVTSLSSRLKFQTAGGTATAITLTGVELTNGFQTTFVIASANNGVATTINTKPLYKPGTTTAPKLVAGKAATVWYNSAGGCFFIKASAEGTATAGDVLAGQTFSNDDDVGIAGALALSGTAGVGDVLGGKTFYNTDAKTVQTGTGANAKRWAQGSFTYPSTLQTGDVSITGLTFTPSVVLFLLDCTSAGMYSLNGKYNNDVSNISISGGTGTSEKFVITPISGGFTYGLAGYSSSGYQILNNPITWIAFE